MWWIKSREPHTELVNGRPIHRYKNNDAMSIMSTDDLTEEHRKFLFWWIKDNLEPSDKTCRKGTSCQLRHIMQLRYDLYVYDTQFMDAMVKCGFEPVDVHEYDWRFRVSPKSKAFHICKHCEGCEYYKKRDERHG